MKEPVWLDEGLILALHAELLAEHGGLVGRPNVPLLEATLARARHRFDYGEQPVSLFGLAASYGFGFAKNHAFSDGNKRIALAAVDVFLQLNGFELEVSEIEAVAAIQDLAAGKLSERKLAAWIELRAVKLKRRR